MPCSNEDPAQPKIILKNIKCFKSFKVKKKKRVVLGKVILMGNENKTGVMTTGRSVETRLHHDKYFVTRTV